MFDIKAASQDLEEGIFHVIGTGNDLIILASNTDEPDGAAERGADFRATAASSQLTSGIETRV